MRSQQESTHSDIYIYMLSHFLLIILDDKFRTHSTSSVDPLPPPPPTYHNPPFPGSSPPPPRVPGSSPPPLGYPGQVPPPLGYPGQVPPPLGYPGQARLRIGQVTIDRIFWYNSRQDCMRQNKERCNTHSKWRCTYRKKEDAHSKEDTHCKKLDGHSKKDAHCEKRCPLQERWISRGWKIFKMKQKFAHAAK